MPVYSKPDLTRAWASGAAPGDIIDPDVAIPGKYAAGWSAEIPPFEFFNFLQQQFSQGLAHINQHGIGVWDSNTEYQNGALVKGSNNYIYRALSANQNVNPVTNTNQTTWRVMFSPDHGKTGFVSYLSTGPANPIYTPPANVTAVTLELIGGGGGAGGTGTTGVSNSAVSVGGGGGAYVRAEYSRSGVWASQISLSFGGGTGAGATGANPGDNGASVQATVGSVNVLGAGGGSGGLGMAGQTNLIRNGATGGAASVSGSGNTVYSQDGDCSGACIVAEGVVTAVGASGSGPFGGSKRPVATSDNAGIAGIGCGGGGVYVGPLTITSYKGGDGGIAVAIITEYYV